MRLERRSGPDCRVQAISRGNLARDYSEHKRLWDRGHGNLFTRLAHVHDNGSERAFFVRGQGQGRPSESESAGVGTAHVEVPAGITGGQAGREMVRHGEDFQAGTLGLVPVRQSKAIFGRFQCCQTLTTRSTKQTIPPSTAARFEDSPSLRPSIMTADPAMAAPATANNARPTASRTMMTWPGIPTTKRCMKKTIAPPAKAVAA